MVILASRSPRRQELLRYLVPEFQVIPSGFDESTIQESIPPRLVRRLAQEKAAFVAKNHPEDVVIGCDTIVVSPKGEVFGIPKDEADARRMLGELSDKTHRVISGCCVMQKGKQSVFHQTTKVTFSPLTQADIDWYIATGEPFDKAGGYGIQGLGGLLIERINGSWHNVVGFPIQILKKILPNYQL